MHIIVFYYDKDGKSLFHQVRHCQLEDESSLRCEAEAQAEAAGWVVMFSRSLTPAEQDAEEGVEDFEADEWLENHTPLEDFVF